MSRNASNVGPGSSLGRYRLVERIASGGMGDVWRAFDSALLREVALKILPGEAFTTDERRRRFQAEARSAAGVSHPNLVPVYDVGESEGVPFIVQEFVNGETIHEILKLGPVAAERAAEYGLQAAEGLAKAHAAGIIHRDVKPGNLIVGRDGRLRVLDFGLAKMFAPPPLPSREDAFATKEGVVVGTVHYMSPEQAMGRELDPRSDIYSLGIVLYEMVTGKRPFDGDSAVDVMHAIVYSRPRAFQVSDPPVPAELAAILEKSLEKKPDERYQSTQELAVDLRRFLKHSGGTQEARRLALGSEPTIEVSGAPPKRTIRRGFVFAGLAGVALIALAFLGRGRARVHAPAAGRVLIQSESVEQDPVFSPDGRAFAYSSNARGDFDIYYRLLSGGSPVRLTDSTEDERDPFFTPDGSAILFDRGDSFAGTSAIWSVPTLGGPPRRILDAGDQPVLSADGKQLLFRRRLGGKTSLWVADADGSSPRLLLDGGSGEIRGARFSRDGRTIAFFWTEAFPGALGDLWKIAAAGGKPERLTTDRRDVWGHVDFLPTGEVVFSSMRTGIDNIWMVSASGGTPRSVTTGGASSISPSVSPDGRSLLVQTRRILSDAWEYSLPEGRGHALTSFGNVWASTRMPDKRLLYGDWSRQEEEIDLFIEDETGTRTFLTQGSNARAARDGKHVYFSTATGGGHRAICEIAPDGGPMRRLTNPNGKDEYPDPTPDGKGLVFCRTLDDGKTSVVLLSLGSPDSVTTLFEGDAMSSRVTRGEAVFRSCAPDQVCGVYSVPLAGGTPRLLVRDGQWPAVSRDGNTVYAWAGPVSKPALFSASLAAAVEARRLFEFNPGRDPQFWKVFTLDVGADDTSLIVTRQRADDDVVLLEGVFQ